MECWDVSTAFLYARLFGDRDTDLGGNEIYMRPPRILVETNVVTEGVVWKIKKALYGLRTSPIAWETERDNTLKNVHWCMKMFHTAYSRARDHLVFGRWYL